jgi:hypothetical protein
MSYRCPALRWSVAALCLLMAVKAEGQTKIIAVNALENSGVVPASGPLPSVVVTFDTPLPAESDVRQNTRWSVSAQGRGTNRALTVRAAYTQDLSTEHAVYLQLNVDFNFFCYADPRQETLQVVYQSDTEYVPFGPATITCPKKAGAVKPVAPLASAKRENDSDIFVNGSYTGVKNGAPAWDLDTFGGYMKEFNGAGALGAYAQAKTSSAKTADLDSFEAYGSYVYTPASRVGFVGPFQVPFLAYRFIGGEFDRKLNQLNLIQSPTIVVPFRLATKGAVAKDYSSALQWPTMTATMGVEVVNARESALPITHRWYTRGLIGATFAAAYAPDTPKFNAIAVTSTWQLRLPSAPEIFYDRRFAPVNADGTKGDPPAMAGTQPRHYLDTTITYKMYRWIGVSFEHSYGSLPPAFNITDHTYKIGLSLTLKQSNAGRYAIIRPISPAN